MTYIEDGASRLISRKQNQFKSFGPLNAALSKLPVQNAMIDSQIVCLDAKSKSVFLDMRRRKANAIIYCFDLLWLNNEDLRNLPLVERKLRLRHLIRTAVKYESRLAGRPSAAIYYLPTIRIENEPGTMGPRARPARSGGALAGGGPYSAVTMAPLPSAA